MSIVTTRKATLLAMAVALVGGSAALANQPMGVDHSQVAIPHGDPNAAACAAGFTANPSTIQGSNPYSQSYTCTGPAIVCSYHFTAQPSVAGTIPGQGQSFGQTIYGSPVTIKGGHMVYTCAEPQPPPR
jgi:hypothetical protein